jgi:hypothetical protein
MKITAKHQSTCIGSLPHHNIDAALEFSFKLGIPFLPQIPIRNSWEFMIPQALEGMPGLQTDKDGTVSINMDVWLSRTHAFKSKLNQAFESTDASSLINAFEPSSASSSCWQPFLWELGEKEIPAAKVQIAGPLTCQWAIRKDNHQTHASDLSSQVFQVVLAKSLAMTRKLKQEKVQPILYIDEPGLFAFSHENPSHLMLLQQLKIMIQTLQKEEVIVGLHCCSQTHWPSILGLGLNFLSMDTTLSLSGLIGSNDGKALETFVKNGSNLSLGVIPTGPSVSSHSFSVHELFNQLMEVMSQQYSKNPAFISQVLRNAIYTPACGLALHSVTDAEYVLEILGDFENYVMSTLK